MSAHSMPSRSVRLHAIAIAAFASAILAFIGGIPAASAEPDANVPYLLNDRHVADGCAPYGGSDALFQAALQIAQSMAANNGRRGAPGTFAPTTEQLLSDRGYVANGLGELDYYNPNRVSTRQAYNFWMNNGTRDLLKDCGLQQMAVAVWIVDNHMAVVALMATPA